MTRSGLWATDHGFRLPPDAPEVLDFYANRSPIFMAAASTPTPPGARPGRLATARPVHLTIPTDNPWVPLRILALGRTAAETIQADVFLLTDEPPAMLPDPDGILARRASSLDHSAAASSTGCLPTCAPTRVWSGSRQTAG